MSEEDRTSIMRRGKLINDLDLRINVEDDQAPWRKLADLRRNKIITEFAEQRQPQCWLCGYRPVVWVREVIFDLGDGDSEPIMKTALVVNSGTYPGPVPGFCSFHLGKGPSILAEMVYNDSTIVTYGFRPTRWFVVFTDGSRARGKAIEIDHDLTRKPQTHDIHLKQEHNQ